jgi:hypothetical protein|tara:strand:- start:539 stop:748 length:210 start_codon:yes stop_codon:yes gene_type:complete
MKINYKPSTALPLEDLKTQALLDLLQELVDLHEGAMQSTTRLILEREIVSVHEELDTREETNKAWEQAM